MRRLDSIALDAGIFSFFSGAGFLDLGFETTEGFNVLFANEYHAPFMDVYRSARRGMGIDLPIYGHDETDIAHLLISKDFKRLSDQIVEARTRHKLIGFIGGPPCPDFSVGGKNKGHKGENGRLSSTYVDLICKLHPDFFIFENVKGLYRTAKHRDFFEKLKDTLSNSGYNLTEKLINAIEYGAPQDRERIILIGFLERDVSKFDWSQGIRYSVDELAKLAWPTKDIFVEDGERECPEGIIEELTVQYWFQQNQVENHPNASHHFIPRGGLPRFQSVLEGDDSKKSYKRFHRWRYSPTAAYGNNEVHLHPYKARRISASEALAIQSIPAEFVIPPHITLSNMFKTIGNGVPYLASRGIASAIKNFVDWYG